MNTNPKKIQFCLYMGIILLSVFFIATPQESQAHPEYTGTWGNCHAYLDASEYPECAYDKLEPYFGEKTWIAQEIASGESSCNPEQAREGDVDVGLFQVNQNKCGQTFTCSRTGDTVTLSPRGSGCKAERKDAETNKIVACALVERKGSDDGSEWGDWGSPSTEWGTVPTDKCNLTSSVLGNYCPYNPGAEPQSTAGGVGADCDRTAHCTGDLVCRNSQCVEPAGGNGGGACGTWGDEIVSGGSGTGSGGSGGTIVVGEFQDPLDPATGQPVELGPINCNVDWPTIPLPGGGFSLNDVCDGSVTPSIGQLIVFIYGAALWISGLAAFVTLVYAGFLYIFSGANPTLQGKAKTYITNVAWGIGILLLSFITLQLINPDITELEFNTPLEVRVCQDPSETECIQQQLPPSTVDVGRFSGIPVTDPDDVEDNYPLCPGATGEGDVSADDEEVQECMEENYGAFAVRDDDEAQASCAGACMLNLGDPLLCRNIGATDDGVTHDPHHAWQLMNAGDEPWDFSGESGSPDDDDFAEHEEGDRTISNADGRACALTYVEDSIDTPADIDYCICNEPSAFESKTCEDFGSCEPTAAE